MSERFEVQRTIAAPAAEIFAVLVDPQGHVAIDASGMLQDATGEPAGKVGDQFVIHMDREALNDFPMGKYDVTVDITAYEQDRLIAWTVLGRSHPGDLVLRLVEDRRKVARGRHFPGAPRDRTACHARHSGSDGSTRLSEAVTSLDGAASHPSSARGTPGS